MASIEGNDPDAMLAAKAALRAAMRRLRARLTPAQRDAAARSALRSLTAYEPYLRARTVLLYHALPGEVPTDAILEDAWARGKRVALPRTLSRMDMAAFEHAPGDALEPGRFRVLEPRMDARRVPAEDIDMAIVPGLAFDACGVRLGYGAGYYDRYLCGRDAHRVGLCYAFQVLPSVPGGPNDRAMDALAAEGGLILCCGG